MNETKTIMYEDLRLKHPAELEGEPQEVAAKAAGDLEEAAAVVARHVVATTRQARSGFLSHELSLEPKLTPEQLKVRWDESGTARACLALVRASRAMNTAVRELAVLQSGQEVSKSAA